MRVCPFCSYNEGWTQTLNTKPTTYKVVCSVCEASGPNAYSRERAIDKWDGMLSQINGEEKFKEALSEASYASNPRDMFWYAWEAYAGNVYEDDEEGIGELMKRVYSIGPHNINEPYDLLDAVANIEFADGPIPEEDLDSFTETLFHYLQVGEFVNEDMGGGGPAGGVSAPMATLTNTPGMGNATPSPSAGLNTDGPAGSGDRWDNDTEDKPKKKKKKKKIAVKESYNDFEDIDPEYTGKQYVGYDNRRWEVIDYRRRRDPEVLIRPLLNPYKNGPASISNARIGPLWISINELDIDDDIYEMNTNPYDKIADMMSKKMGVSQPFKKKDSKNNTVEQNIIDEVANPSVPFKIETLDSYEKAGKLVPAHPLQEKKKKRKVNEEELQQTAADQESMKDVKSKNKLTDLGIPFVYKPGPSGKKRVYIKMDINQAVKKLEDLEWTEVGSNPENTLRKYHDKDKTLEFAIFADGKDLPRVTLKPISESNSIKKLISNSLEPYIKK